MHLDPSDAFPPPTARYRGPAIAAWILVAYTLMATARSLVHILAPDGGAMSIAGIDVTVAGGDNIVAMFGQWGLEQLLLAAVAWVVLLRYRAMIPAAILLGLIDVVGRFLVGQLKPITSAHTPPGEIGTYLLIPVLLLTFLVSLLVRDPDAGH